MSTQGQELAQDVEVVFKKGIFERRQAGDGLGDRFDQAAQLGERLWQARAEAGDRQDGAKNGRGGRIPPCLPKNVS